jgi:acyl transferase domain-containing protein
MMVPELEVSVGLCPGQGGYRRGALDVVGTHPRAAEAVAVVDETTSEVLGRSLLATLAEHAALRDEDLFAAEPEVFQLAVFATSVGVFEVFRTGGAQFSVLIGHSLGEIAALACSGGLSVAEGARILCHRLAVLREHDLSGGGMLALACGRERAERIVELLPTAGVVVAVDNGPRQSAVSGPAEALRRVERIAEAIGVPSTRLYAAHPFHNAMLQAARDALAERIRGHRGRTFAIPVFSPVLGRYYRSQDDLGELLASHLTSPVQFGPALQRAQAAGARVWVELGAGRTLTNLVRSVRPEDTLLAPLAGPSAALDEAVAFLAGEPRPQPSAAAQTSPATLDGVPASPTSADAAPAPPTAAPEPPVAVDAAPTPARTAPPGRLPLSRQEIEARIRALYANALEYPEEVFEPTAELEADLGVDSVKQTELMARLGEEFVLGPRPEGLRMGDYRTFGRLVDFVSDALSVGNGHR